MAEFAPLTLEVLTNAVAGGVAAVRSTTRLIPVGGPADKVFPPTYATGDRTLKYATETRRVEGAEVLTVLLDSVASQANRMEEALFSAWETGDLDFPVILVDFRAEEGLFDLDRISSLHTPHRIADALLRDSVVEDGTSFRETDAGRAYTDATPRNATAVYRYCPTALVFGVWDSTGPKGGSGSKFQRALVSEIVGFGAVTGRKVSSRIDPAGIESKVTVYKREANEHDWTIHPDEARKGAKGDPEVFSHGKGEGKKGSPSTINHGNIAPSIDDFAGGVTIDYAVQTTVLSLPALRRLRFPTDASGKTLDGKSRLDAERAARTALAALALAAVSCHRDEGYDLRSRCALVPTGPFVLEIVPADGSECAKYTLSPAGAAEILRGAHEKAAKAGFPWERVPLALKPAPKLAELIRKSRELATGDGPGEDGVSD
jgi:CRISPR-associated protein Csb1